MTNELNTFVLSEINNNVAILLADASDEERKLLDGIEPELIDGAVTALSNLVRRKMERFLQQKIFWIQNEFFTYDYVLITHVHDSPTFEVARYLQLWDGDNPSKKCEQLVRWAQLAVARVPTLFQYVSCESIQHDHIILSYSPDEWNKSNTERWSKRKV